MLAVALAAMAATWGVSSSAFGSAVVAASSKCAEAKRRNRNRVECARAKGRRMSGGEGPAVGRTAGIDACVANQSEPDAPGALLKASRARIASVFHILTVLLLQHILYCSTAGCRRAQANYLPLQAPGSSPKGLSIALLFPENSDN